MHILFDCDPSACSACTACAVACMDQNDVDVFQGESPLRRIISYEPKEGGFLSYSISCMHCPDAACVRACPTGCLYKDSQTGLTLYHQEKCIGCHSCAAACSYGAPSFRKDGKMFKCDGCVGRLKAGLKPACVHACPSLALTCTLASDEKTPALFRTYPPLYQKSP